MADLEQQIPITPNSVFDVASVSKQFTGLAIVILESENKLNPQSGSSTGTHNLG